MSSTREGCWIARAAGCGNDAVLFDGRGRELLILRHMAPGIGCAQRPGAAPDIHGESSLCKWSHSGVGVFPSAGLSERGGLLGVQDGAPGCWCGLLLLTLHPSQRLTLLRIHTVWAMGDEPDGYAARPDSAVNGNYGKADWNCMLPA